MRFTHSQADWCWRFMGPEWPTPLIAETAVKAGASGVDLADPKDWAEYKQAGLQIGCVLPAMEGAAPFELGFHHEGKADLVEAAIHKAIDDAVGTDAKTVIVFTGMEVASMAKDEAKAKIVAGLKRVAGYAKGKGVKLVLEMLNSRVNAAMKGHPGYLGDSTQFCLEIVEEVNEPRSLLLVLDFYHIVIMGEDPLAVIQMCAGRIGYVHVAGAWPLESTLQRAELHLEGQVIDYPKVMIALAAAGYSGWVCHEFPPTIGCQQGLEKSIGLCEATP